MEVVDVADSGNPNTDALIEGPKWAGTSLTFSFPTAAAQFTGYSDGEPFNNFEGLNSVQQAAVRSILASLSTFTNLTFTESTGADASSAVLRFGMTDDTPTAHAYLPAPQEYGGDSWYRNSDAYYDDPAMGNYGWLTFEHEIGHALGLGHPHESTPPMDVYRDWMPYTVMSYRSSQGGAIYTGYTNEDWGFAQTYMMEDIAALQFLYGANFSHNSSSSVYQWNPLTGEMSINGVGQGAPGENRVFMTLWDGGGSDTYDFSNYPADPNVPLTLTIDLRPGSWTTLPPDQRAFVSPTTTVGNIANALLYNNDTRSLIENAIGSAGADLIHGNDGANVIDGGLGPDEIHGYGGDDMLTGERVYGGDGNDTIHGGQTSSVLEGNAGNDIIHGSPQGDAIFGGDGDDWLYSGNFGGIGDTLIGGAGNDTLIGGDGNDTLNGGEGNDALHGGGADDILIGFPGDDTITGGDGNDSLYGGPGADMLSGGAGNDLYELVDDGDQAIELPGEGIDSVYVSGSYTAPADIENIVLERLPFGAVLTGNQSNNLILGSSGSQTLIGGSGADEMRGSWGDDTYYVDDPDDLVFESNREEGGYDTVYSSVSYVLREAAFDSPTVDPRLVGGSGYFIDGGNRVELLVLTGTANLSGTGNSFANTIQGNSGDNVLNGGGGADQLVGGAGADVFLYLDPNDSIAGQMDWLSDFASGTDLVDLREIDFADMSFSAFDDASTLASIATVGGITMVIRIAGLVSSSDFILSSITQPSQILIGTNDDDTLTGGAGDDYLDGRGGVDTMTGGAGNDIYFVDNAGDQVVEAAGGGHDTVFTSVTYALAANVERLVTYDPSSTLGIDLYGNDLANEITGNAGANLIFGGGGADLMTGAGGDDTYYVDNAGDVVSEGAGGGYDTIYTSVSFTLNSLVERLIVIGPSSVNPVNLTGNAFANALVGNDGANVIDGGGAADLMTGRGGNDIYFVDNAGDQILEAAGDGYDTVFASLDYTLGAEIERVVAYDPASTSALGFTGNALANEITGNAGANLLDGGTGADFMSGLGGNDIYFVDDAQDFVLELAANGYDTVFASVRHTLAANVERVIAFDPSATTALHFTGNSLANEISGNAGGNMLDGGAGADVLMGLGGDDAFVFSSALGGGNIDTMVDFETGGDRIYLAGSVFTGLAAGQLAAGAFVIGSAAADADDRIVYDQATGALYFDADGNGAGAMIQFASVHDGLVLAASDFQLI